jgi:hypothetical protein
MSYITENRGYADVVQLLLGVGLFASPWLFGFADAAGIAWHAWIAGVALAVLAGLSLAREQLRLWVSWATLAIGVWLILAPWIVGFSAITAAMWSHLIVGVIMAVIALLEVAGAYSDTTVRV